MTSENCREGRSEPNNRNHVVSNIITIRRVWLIKYNEPKNEILLHLKTAASAEISYVPKMHKIGYILLPTFHNGIDFLSHPDVINETHKTEIQHTVLASLISFQWLINRSTSVGESLLKL